MTRPVLPLAALSLVAAAPAAVDLQVLSRGSTRDRLAHDDADLVVLYVGEQEGHLGPCGCADVPLGGVDRAAGYAAAVRAEGRPTILVDPGAWLTATLGDDGESLRPDAVADDRAMVDALAGWEALNVSFRDLPFLAAHGFPAAAVSANLRASEGEAPAPVILLERGGRRIAVTGVTSWGTARIQPSRFTWEDPTSSLAAVLADVQADVVVVLSYGIPARSVAIPGVDVVVEASQYRELDPPFLTDAGVAVRSWTAGERMGELRLHLADGRVATALERVVALDPRIRPDRGTARTVDAHASEIEAAEREQFGP